MHGEVLTTDRLGLHLCGIVRGCRPDGFTSTGDSDEYVNCFFLPPEASYAPPFEDDAVRDLPREQRPYPRRITVRSWDSERRQLTLDIAAHGQVGYAGRWALNAVPGDRLQLRGPAGGYRPPGGRGQLPDGRRRERPPGHRRAPSRPSRPDAP